MGEFFNFGSTNPGEFEMLDELDMMENDFREMKLERTITSGLKTAEEIERLTVDEQLSDIERAVYLLCSGQDVQRISVVQNLPELLRDNQVECMRRVIPKIREILHLTNYELQEAATISFVVIAEEEIIPHLLYAQTFLQTVLQNVDNRDPDISEAWLDVLLQIIPHLPKEVIKRDILSVAIAKGQLNMSVQSRLASCQILGKAATKFDSFMIKKDILPLVTALCQDVDYEVRACMCKELSIVARGLGLEPTRSAILPELVELSHDEESCVRLSALETIVNLLSLLDDDTCNQTIIPLVCKYCENAMENKDVTLPSVARQFGKLCHGLSVNLTEDQKIWCLNYFRELCIIGLNEKPPATEEAVCPRILALYKEEDRHRECRFQSAFNFPCMVLFAGARNFKTELQKSFSSLGDDREEQVRVSLAKGFHEVAKLLGNCVSDVRGDLINLLKDESLLVIEAVISHLSETFEAFSRGTGHINTESKQPPGLAEVIPALLSAEARAASSRNWRLHTQILESWGCLPKGLTSEQIYQKFVPVIFKCITSHKPLPVHHAACKTICLFIKHNRKVDQRQELCSKLIEECRNHQSSRYRKLFIDMCLCLIEVFSKSFFNEHFFEKVIELAEDPVPNVRFRCCSLLPKLKSQLKLPKDRQLLQQLDFVVRKLMVMEKDRDVTAAIRQAVGEMDKIQVVVQSMTQKQYFEDDLLDQKKEEEERLLVEAEKKRTTENGEKESGLKAPSSAKSTISERGRNEIKMEKNQKSSHSTSSSNPSPNTLNKNVPRAKTVGPIGRKSTGSTTPVGGPPSNLANRAASKITKLKKADTNNPASSSSSPSKLPTKTGKKSPAVTGNHEQNNNTKPALGRCKSDSNSMLASAPTSKETSGSERLKKRESSTNSSLNTSTGEVRRVSSGGATHERKGSKESSEVPRHGSAGSSLPMPKATRASSVRSSTTTSIPSRLKKGTKP